MAETLSDRLKQVPGLRQLMLLVGIAAAVAVGVTVFFWSQSPAMVPVYTGLNERDMAAVADVPSSTRSMWLAAPCWSRAAMSRPRA